MQKRLSVVEYAKSYGKRYCDSVYYLQMKNKTMKQVSEISSITFRSGMVDKLSETSKCPAIILNAPEIPADILKQMQEDDYKSLKVRYGDPSLGEPIQYDYLEIASSSGVKTLEVFNRAILLLSNNTDETRRVHRIVYAVEKHIKAAS